MLQMIEANWLVFVIALAIGLIVAWWVFARGSTISGTREHRKDVLDEGVGPAQRNQALIDAPPAAEIIPSAAAGTMAGVAEVVAVAAQDSVQEAAVHKTQATAVAAAPSDGDDLTRIKGVGPKLVALLQSLGITRFEQIANWTDDELAAIDAQLGAFQGRAQRDNWIEQAKMLAGGDTAAYEAKFGKL